MILLLIVIQLLLLVTLWLLKSASSTADVSFEVSSEEAAAQIPSCSTAEVHSEPSGSDTKV